MSALTALMPLEWPVLALVGFLALLIALVATMAARPLAGLRKKTETPVAAVLTAHAQTTLAFRALVRRIKGLNTDKAPLYAAPWVLLLGAEGAGKSKLLDASGLEELEPGAGPSVVADVCALHLLTTGVAIDMSAACLPAAGATGGAGWTAVLRELQTRRRLRPLDAVALAISCRDLLLADRASLIARGDRIRNWITSLQRSTGLTLPIYIVLTHADALPGFRAFWNRQSSLGDILGWTNPEPGGGWTANVAQTALGAARDALWSEFVERSASGSYADPDAAFRLPEEAFALAEPLGTLLERAFRPNAFEDRSNLRGVYLTGRTEENGPPGFAKDLFAELVFGEARLARAGAVGVIGRTRAIRAVQITGVVAAALMCASLFTGERAVSDLSNRLVDVLRFGGKPSVEPHATDAGARRLLDALGRVDRDGLAHAAFPTSWVSPIEERVVNGLTAVISAVAITPIKTRLKQRYAAMIAEQLPSEQDADIALTEAKDFLLAASYMERLRTLDRRSEQYNDLNRIGIKEISELLSFVYEAQLDANFENHSDLYARAIRDIDVEPFKSEGQKGEALRRARALAERVLRRIEQDGYVERAVFLRVSEAIAAVEDLAGSSGIEQGRNLAAALAEADAAMSDPRFRWTSLDDVRADPTLAAWLDMIEESSPDTAKALREKFNLAITTLRTRVSEISDPRGQRIFRVNENGLRTITFSPTYAKLAKAARVVMARPFMLAAPEPASFGQLPTGAPMLMWDVQRLEKARAIHAQFEDARLHELADLPSNYARLFDRLVSAQASRAMQAEIRRAAMWVARPTSLADDASLATEARALKEAAQLLGELADLSKQTSFFDVQATLANLLREQTQSLLTRVDVLAQDEALYLPVDAFRRWSGAGPLTSAGFLSDDEAALSAMLDSARARIEFLWETIARTPVEFIAREDLADRMTHGPVFERWRQTGAQLREYRTKNPASALAQLENFIRFELPAVKLEECVEKLDGKGRRGSDLFSERTETIRRFAVEQCRRLQAGAVTEVYEELTQRFNHQLAGHFPFAPPSTPPEAEEADAGQIDDFMRWFEGVEAKLRPALARRAQADHSAEPALRFVERLDKLKPLLAALTQGAGAYPAPGLEVSATFRINRAREAGANQIIDWRLDIAGQPLRRDAPQTDGGQSPNGPAPLAAWRPGQPVSMAMRWVKDGPTRPLSDPKAGPNVDDLTARFSYGGGWALLRMLARHRPATGDLEHGIDATPITLAFITPVGGQAGDGKADALPPVKGFVQISLTAPGPDGNARIRLLAPEFPMLAPRLPPPPSNKTGKTK